MANYLLKYKGQYRILPEIDQSTNDFPRNSDGSIIDNDIYIACQYGNKIALYRHKGNQKEVWLIAYIPSIGRGRNIKKALDEQRILYTNYLETDSEIEFHFKAKDIEPIAKLLKVKTSGANISPFSSKNLPKSKVEIPSEEIEHYKEISAKVSKEDLLIIHKITQAFLSSMLEKKIKKSDKSFDFKTDMKLMCLGRQTKEYIYKKGFWQEYLTYLQKEITKFYKK